MPGSRVHTVATVVTMVGMSFLPFPMSENALLISGAASTLVINPDLDLNTKRPKGPLFLFWLYTWPYSRIMPHRSFLSHFPIISTLIRVVYFGWPIFVIFEINIPMSILFVIGMIASDTVHYVLDIATTSAKGLTRDK